MTRTWSWAVAAALVVGLVPATAGAQEGTGEESPVLVGSKVRLRAGSLPQGIQGTIVEMDDRTLIVSQDQRAVRVSRADITRLEISNGRRRQARKGALIGAIAGAGTFAALSRETYCAEYYDDGEACPGRAEMVATGVLGGAAWGALIGHFVKTERWTLVSEPGAQVRLAPSFSKGGLGLKLSVAW